jgi:hypothetical protein
VDGFCVEVDGEDVNPHSTWKWGLVGDEKLSFANQLCWGGFGGDQELNDCAILGMGLAMRTQRPSPLT